MTRSTKHVGLDVHQHTTLTTVREDSGRIISRSILATEAPALLEYFRNMRGAIHVAFEEGTQAQWLHDLLVPVVDRVIVCDRRGTTRQGNKADQSDADELSDLLRCGRLRAVYHGGRGTPARLTLKELAHTYQNLVEDATRLMSRLKALFRARGIKAPGQQLYQPAHRAEWLERLTEPGARFRAATLFAQLDPVQALRPPVKQAMLAEARRDPSWGVLRRIPFLGPVRVAQLLATAQTPWRFRTKRHFWAYVGLAVVTRTTAQYEIRDARPVRRQRAPLTRGLNQNHSRVLKNVFKGAATAATVREGALRTWYEARRAQGMREEMARLTLARKLAAVTLHVWKTGDRYDATKLTLSAARAR
jgi:transposase